MTTTLTRELTTRRVLYSEWTKFRSVRSSWWSIAVATVLTVGIGIAISLAAAADRTSTALASNIATRSEIGTIFAQLALGTLGVLMMSGDYGTGMIRSSMTVVPKRLPVLWAKLTVYAAVVITSTMVTSLAAFLLGQLVWRGNGRLAVSLGDPGVARIVVGASLYLTVAGLCAIAIATLLRSTAASITAVVGLFFVLPTVLTEMPAGIANAAKYLPSNAGGAMSGLATSSHVLRPWAGFVLLCGYAVVAVAAAAWRLRRSDV